MTTQLQTVRGAGAGAAAPAFCFGHVAGEDRAWLEARTEEALVCAERTARDAIRIGEILIAVANRLPGHFDRWLAAKMPFSRTQAYRLIAVAEAFGRDPSQIETFDKSALYLLAQEKTPKAAREHALDLARGGERITRRLAQDILDAHKPVRVDDRAARQLDALVEDLHLYRDDDGKMVDQAARTRALEEKEERRLAAIGKALEALVRAESVVNITKVDDPDDVDLFSVTARGAGEARARTCVDRNLYRALAEVAGEVETKYCPKCDARKPTCEFGNNADQPDLLMARCKACERARKKHLRKRKKRRRQRAERREAERRARPGDSRAA